MKDIKNVYDYGYNGNEEITITAQEFTLLKLAVEQGITATQRIDYPEVTAYVSKTTGKNVKNPSKEDILASKVTLTTDKEATFTSENAKVTYDGAKLRPEMLYAQELVLDIHLRNIEAGIAKSAEELKKANELTQV